MNLLIRLILGILFFLFSFGIYSLAEKFCFFISKKFLIKNRYFFSQSLIFVFLLLIYCIICNGIFLLVPIFEYTKLISYEQLTYIKYFVELFLISILIYISTVGFNFLNFQNKKNKIKIKDFLLILRENNLDRLNKILNYTFLSSPILFYILFFPPSLLNLIGDTGLYHLPYVNHLAHFGIEKGLVYLNYKYTFYNVTLYGQAPFQIFLKYLNFLVPSLSENIISPSLNILFFSGFLIYLKENFIDIRKWIYKANKDSGQYINKIFKIKNIAKEDLYRIILYNFLIFSFIPLIGFNLKFSLLSYNCDFVLAIITLILTHSITKSFIFGNHDLAFYFLIFLLPIIKLSSSVSLLFIGICYLFFMIIFEKNKISFNFLFKKSKNNIKKYIFYYIFLILIAFTFFFITNIIQTGYLLYPSSFFGPIGEHALSINKLQELKLILINWSRYINHSELIYSGSRYADWFPVFFKSKIGLFMIFVFIFSVYNVLWNFLGKNKIYSFVNLIYSSSLLITLISVILFLPPDLRFYSWIIAITFYLVALNYFQNLLTFFYNSLSILITILIIFYFSGTLMNLAGFQMPNVNNIKMGTSQYVIKSASSDNWSHRNGEYNSKIPIKIPEYQSRCWNIEPPCTNSGSYLILEE